MPKTRINKTASAKTNADWWPENGCTICRLADMPEDSARGFSLVGDAADEMLDIIIWHRTPDDIGGAGLFGFVNKCPHLGLPLETFPDRFLSADGTALICSAHGARFDADGACFSGPCQGDRLANVPLAIEERDGEAVITIQKPQTKQ